jgi:arginase
VLLLPYHQDERLSLDSIVLPDDRLSEVLDVELPDGTQWARLVALYDAMADRVAGLLTQHGPLTVITGDCLATLGTLAGLQRAGVQPSLVWFDAHGDVHTVASSESGYLGGMALRMAVGGDVDRLTGPLGIRPLAESSAVLVDARDLDPAEQAYLAASDVRRVSVDEIDASLLPDGPILVHVDLDVIDAGEIPGLRFPVTGGPASSRVIAAIQRLRGSGQVAALDLACPWYEPVEDREVTTRQDVLGQFLSTSG